ncbi:MAG: hypothetical protein MJB14_06205 [Spirochaetes bacterium]|nr:hypothetical protein [Spirochaetota bacterium]
MKILKIIIFLLLIIIIVSCGKPEKDTPKIELLSLVEDFLNNLNRIKGSDEDSLEFFKFMTKKFQAIITFEQDSQIIIRSQTAQPGPDDFIHSLDNNRFILTKDVYITQEEKNLLFSLDNKTWYLNKSDPEEEIEGLKNDYFFEPVKAGNTITINYKMSFQIGRNPLPATPASGKKTIELRKGLVISHQDEEKINANLKEIILHVPSGTILSGKVNIDGNLVKSQSKEDYICIQAIQDIYFFIKNRSFSLSFDQINWNPNILAFEIEPDISVTAINDREIMFDVNAIATYEKGRVSFSLIKLLMANM